MAVRFRKSIKLAPGVRLNVGTKSAGLSFGGKGMRYTINSSGRRTTTVSASGTGLSWSSSSGGKKSSSYKKYSSAKEKNAALAKERQKLKEDKERQKQLEIEQAQAAVAEYEACIEAITTIHRSCDDVIDWQYILSIPKPFERGFGPKAAKIQTKKDNYRPGFITKLFSSEQRDLESLENKLKKAIEEDNKTYDDWYEFHDLSEKVLNKDIDSMLRVIEEMNPLEDLLEYGSGFEISFANNNTVEVEFDINSSVVIPTESLSLTPTGKLSKKALSATNRLDIMQDYVCSCVIRIARDMLAILPIDNVLIHAKDSFINTTVGNTETKDILSVNISRETLSTLNFEMIDPSDSMKNFTHSMKFLKTKGFQPITRIE